MVGNSQHQIKAYINICMCLTKYALNFKVRQKAKYIVRIFSSQLHNYLTIKILDCSMYILKEGTFILLTGLLVQECY